MSDETIQKLKRELARTGTSPLEVGLGMLHFYRLSWATWEESLSLWFASDKKLPADEFQALCDSLVNEASEAAIERAGGPTNRSNLVGWREVVEGMESLLEERGFKPIKPFEIAAQFDGPGIIDDEASATADTGRGSRRGTARAPDSVIEHNRRVDDMIERERHERSERARSWVCHCGRQLESIAVEPFRRHVEDGSPACRETSDPPTTMTEAGGRE